MNNRQGQNKLGDSKHQQVEGQDAGAYGQKFERSRLFNIQGTPCKSACRKVEAGSRQASYDCILTDGDIVLAAVYPGERVEQTCGETENVGGVRGGAFKIRWRAVAEDFEVLHWRC